MSDSTNDGSDNEDYIYRGESSSPQDGQPWTPPTPPPPPPPAGPPAATPHPTSPPPGFPPQQPPVGQALPGMEPPAKKKRWPWVLGAVILFCALPLGGCVALVGFGVNEINSRNDEVESTVQEFFDLANSDASASAAEVLADGGDHCMQSRALVASVQELGSMISWSPDFTAFVERSGNSTLSSNADPEELFIVGRPDESVGVVNGLLETGSGLHDVQVVLSKPASLWRICTITAQ